MSFGASKRSVNVVLNKAPRFARIIPNGKSVFSGLGRHPRATPRQVPFSSVDTIHVNKAAQQAFDDSTPG